MLKTFIAFAVAGALAFARPAFAEVAIVGVNVMDAGLLKAQDSADLLAKLKAAGVTTIRVAATPSALPFVTEAYKQGIGTILITPFIGQADRMRPAAPAMGLTWKAARYSAPDMAAFTTQTRATLDTLDSAGVRLTALEFANEINNAQFNGDFDSEGGHRVLSGEDISHPTTPEVQAIHDGLHAYIAELKVLNQLRDASRANAHTPIISAGLADPGKPGLYSDHKLDSASISGTLAILRVNGLDNLVQGYGVHVYPSNNPNLTEAQRAATLEADTFAACTSSKPCWLTEWGFTVPAKDCPIDDNERAGIATKMRDILAKLAAEKRLAASIYYSWSGHKGVVESNEAIFRCGALTKTGAVALKPF